MRQDVLSRRSWKAGQRSQSQSSWHWLDRIAVRAASAGKPDAESRTPSPPAPGPLGRRLNRRQLLSVTSTSLLASSLWPRSQPALVGASCLDKEYDNCEQRALEEYDKQIRKDPCVRTSPATSVGDAKEAAAAQAGCLEAQALNYVLAWKDCAVEAGKRNCGDCEYCDSSTTTCQPLCSEDQNQVCINGKCDCDKCSRRVYNLFFPLAFSCYPKQCPEGQECNPNTGECESGACGNQTCAPGTVCCSYKILGDTSGVTQGWDCIYPQYDVCCGVASGGAVTGGPYCPTNDPNNPHCTACGCCLPGFDDCTCGYCNCPGCPC